MDERIRRLDAALVAEQLERASSERGLGAKITAARLLSWYEEKHGAWGGQQMEKKITFSGIARVTLGVASGAAILVMLYAALSAMHETHQQLEKRRR